VYDLPRFSVKARWGRVEVSVASFDELWQRKVKSFSGRAGGVTILRLGSRFVPDRVAARLEVHLTADKSFFLAASYG